MSRSAARHRPLLPFDRPGIGVASCAAVDRLCGLARAEDCLVREPEDGGPPVGCWAFCGIPTGTRSRCPTGRISDSPPGK